MYSKESRLRAVIGQVAIISGDEDLLARLETVRASIRALGTAPVEMGDLLQRRERVLDEVDRVMRTAREEMRRS